MKLLFVDSQIGISYDRSTIVLGLTPNPFYDNIQGLIPTIQCNQENQELWYAQYVLTYTAPFLDLMKIIYGLYEGRDVIVLVPAYLSEFVENIIRFLLNRYDLEAYYILDPEDFECAGECEFSIRGLAALDMDKERMCELYKHLQPTIPTPQPMMQRLYEYDSN